MCLQILILIGALIAWCNGLVISGYNGGHGGVFDYASLEDYDAHAVLPTVAVPIHSVSASPLHITAQDLHTSLHFPHPHHEHHPHLEHHPHHEHLHHEHHEPDHDYYVS